MAKKKEVIKLNNDLSNFDNIANSFRTRLDLHGFNIGLFDDKKNILKIIGTSTVLSNLFTRAIKAVTFDFNQNKTARVFFNKLKKTKKISVKDLLKLITDNFRIKIKNKFISNFISVLLKTKLAEIFILPIYKGDLKVGAILVATKFKDKNEKENTLLLENISKEISELL